MPVFAQMLCLACGAEMRLVEVVEDTTMLVSGYEHQTWQCSGCSAVEQRMTFTGKKRRTHQAPLGPVHMGSVEPAQTAAVDTSRMTRECQVRFCERLGVQFPGPTRQPPTSPSGRGV